METFPRLNNVSFSLPTARPEILQDSGTSEIAPITEIRSSHHISRVEHLLSKLWDSGSTERVGSTRSERCESNHEEMETGERNHVDSKFAEVRVQLTRETKTGSDTRHDSRNKMVEISIRWSSKFKRSHADIVKSL